MMLTLVECEAPQHSSFAALKTAAKTRKRTARRLSKPPGKALNKKILYMDVYSENNMMIIIIQSFPAYSSYSFQTYLYF